jgi:Flp pilus assembly pilin Flp
MPKSADTADRALAERLCATIVTLIAATVIASVAAALIDDDLALRALLLLATAVVAFADVLMRSFVAPQVAVHALREREDGGTKTEYAILLGFLAIAIVVALFFLRNHGSQLSGSVSNAPGP